VAVEALRILLGRVGAAGVAVDVMDLNRLLRDERVGLARI
jgi:hypothetical protein